MLFWNVSIGAVSSTVSSSRSVKHRTGFLTFAAILQDSWRDSRHPILFFTFAAILQDSWRDSRHPILIFLLSEILGLDIFCFDGQNLWNWLRYNVRSAY